jgi:hypothetical protein
VLAAIVAAGCSEDPLPAPDDTQTPTLISETLTGTVTVNGAHTTPFTVNKAGNVTVTVSALAPDDTVTLGVALGIWSGVSCQIVVANDAAKLSTSVLGVATAPGSLCVRVFDVGNLSAATDYELKVDHF